MYSVTYILYHSLLIDTWKTSESNITVNKAGSTVTFKTQDDKEVTFKVPKKYLTSQTIDPPTERLRMLWVYVYIDLLL